MSRAFFSSNRCDLFKDIAEDVWIRVIRAHDVDVDLSEIGITSDILVDILQFSKYRFANFDVYAKEGEDEDIFGSDIEVFVETKPGEFRMFALQAKVLKKNNRYTTLRDSSDGIMQWDKLRMFETVTGCKGYFLLYNGKYNWTHIGKDACRQTFTQDEFGCSLVDLKTIEKLATRKSARGRFVNPRFEDIHPEHAQPWHILTCCKFPTNNYKVYNIDEIIASNPLLRRLKYEQSDSERELVFEEDANIPEEMPVVENNKINQGYREAKWEPSLRIINKNF